jgi:phosphomethylpyrimidine synthase
MPKDSDEIVISTGPTPGSRKIFVNAGVDGALRVPFREVKLEDSAKEPPVWLYDTSGPYTQDDVRVDVTAGLPRLRDGWIRARGDVEEYDGRDIKLEDNHRAEGDQDAYPVFPVKHRPLRAKQGV